MVLHIKTGLKHLRDDNYYDAFKELNLSAFNARKTPLVGSFFEDLEKRSIAYILLDINDSNSPQGSVLATFEQPDQEMLEYGLGGNYILIDKVAVSPGLWKNGVLPSMMNVARSIRFGQKQRQIPTVWRTSDPDISKKYERSSDFGDSPAVSSGYYVHGFGFYDGKKANYDNPRSLFEHIAYVVAARPSTLMMPSNNGELLTLEKRVLTG